MVVAGGVVVAGGTVAGNPVAAPAVAGTVVVLTDPNVRREDVRFGEDEDVAVGLTGPGHERD